ncbi:MAG TPA: hypothetical protein VGK25_02780 [Ignavibacteria bacterium]
MFQDFAKRKLVDYLNLLEFPENKITFQQLRHSTLPPFIISFFDYYIPKKIPIERTEFEEILRKGLIFNINYIIRPKYSILKFLFGKVETRPVEFIRERLKYFQFYGYYTMQIVDFIELNSLEFVTIYQIELVINEVNKKIYEEINGTGGNDSHRFNLVKLLYYFFHDLGDNNPINLKLPKKILSVYFADKGFIEIKKRVDNFFSDEIFIQEVVELINPETKRSPKAKSDVDVSEEKLKEIIDKAKGYISKESLNKEVEKILPPDEKIPEEIKTVSIKELRQQASNLPDLDKRKLVIDEDIYSDDLLFVSQFNDFISPPPLTDEEKREKLINELFCEETYRKRIIKKLFSKEEKNFKEFLENLLVQNNWSDVTMLLEKYFNDNKIDYYCEEAVKLVDVLQSHFTDNAINENSKAV